MRLRAYGMFPCWRRLRPRTSAMRLRGYAIFWRRHLLRRDDACGLTIEIDAGCADTQPIAIDPVADVDPQSTGKILLRQAKDREIKVDADLQRLTPLLEPGESLWKSLA